MPGSTTDLLTHDPTFTKLLIKTMISSDFADSGTSTFAETQSLLSLAGIDNLTDVHLTRFKDIARTLKFSDIAAVNNGTAKKGTTDNAFTDVDAVTETDAKNAFNHVAIIAAAKRIFSLNASLNDSNYTNLTTANSTLAAYLTQPISPGVGSSWYKPINSFIVGNLSFKLLFTPNNDNTKFSITEMPSNDTNYDAASFYTFPIPTMNDFTIASALRKNNGTSIMKSTDMAAGAFKAAAAVLLVTGIDTSSGIANLSSINTASQVLTIASLITNVSSGNLVYELTSLTTGNGISKTAIGEASLSDSRLSTGISALNYNDSYDYASNSTPYSLRSVDFFNDPVYQYSPQVTKIIRWLKIVKKDSSTLAEIFIGNDPNSSDIKIDLQSTDANARKALYFTNSTLSVADTSKDKTFTNVYRAATDSTVSSPINLTGFTKAVELAEYISSGGTSNNVTEAPANTSSTSTGINANEGTFNNILQAMVNTSKPSITFDLLFEALKLVANQSNKVRGTFDNIYKIISTWFSTTVSPQKPSTVPTTTPEVFWDIPSTGEFSEDHSKRLFANYILTNYNYRLLSDVRNQYFFDLLFKVGTNSGPNVNNTLQATNLYAFNPNLIYGNTPNSTKIGTADEVYTVLDTKPELSTFTKVRLLAEIQFNTVNTTADIKDLVAVFGKDIIYELIELPLSKDSSELFVTSNTLSNNNFSHSSNTPNGTSTFYTTFTTNNEAHKKLNKRLKVISRLIDIFAEETNSSIKANSLLDLAKNTSDYNNFVRYQTNFNTKTKELFTDIIGTWLDNEAAQLIEDIVISPNTYGSIVTTAIKNYVGNSLNLSNKSLSSATDTVTPNNTSLLTAPVSSNVLAAAQLASKLTKKNPNTDSPNIADNPIQLKDFIGSPSKQDMLLIGYIAAIQDGSKDQTKLNFAGRQALFDAGVSSMDINLLVTAKINRTNPWTLSKDTSYQYLSGRNDNEEFVPDVN